MAIYFCSINETSPRVIALDLSSLNARYRVEGTSFVHWGAVALPVYFLHLVLLVYFLVNVTIHCQFNVLTWPSIKRSVVSLLRYVSFMLTDSMEGSHFGEAVSGSGG
jgi:hypothetical protein